jgi:hypothetical protein
MGIKVANNAFGTLAASITNSDTSITLTSGQGARFPSLGAGDYFYATLIDTSNNLEIVKCTARSTDVLTVTRAQESTTARAYSTGDRIEIRITAKTFEDAIPTVYDVTTTSTGFFDMPAGTTAQRPGSPTSGATRFNTETGSLEFYDGTDWISTNLIPSINSVTGTIYAGQASTLTLSLTNTTDTITVRFSEGGVTVADVTGVAVTSGSASVAVPAAVFGQTAGDTIAVSVINQDGTPSSNAINKTVQGLPTGGTITTSGGYRIHTFTSSSSFVVPSGLTLSDVEYLVIAGGGGGGADDGGGGGAGGYRCSVVGESSGGGASAEARLTLSPSTYTVTVGAGGAPGIDGVSGQYNGSNSVFSTITSLGGGAGGTGSTPHTGASGGSGGGGHNAFASVGGSGTSGQGYAGGQGNQGGINGAGGGGAGQTGGQGDVRNSFGGNGVASAITGTSVTRGGGGGGGSRIYNYPLGGTGGGGAGSFQGSATPNNGAGSPGGANTGGGGGGGNGTTSGGLSRNGGSGGSGIVIVRYQL